MPIALRRPRARSRIRTTIAVLTAVLGAATHSTAADAACGADALPGVNVSGGEFNPSSTHYAYDYIHPQQAEVDLMKSLQLKLLRVPFARERIQPTASGPLSADEMSRLDGVVSLATANGITVVLDPHNYGSYQGVSLGSASSPPGALPDLWTRIAQRYANNPNVVFGLVNEPHDITADVWARIAQQTLSAIRATGAKNRVLIPGTNRTGAQSWFDIAGSTSNAAALLPLARADANIAFEVHQTYDTGYSGTTDTCEAASNAISALDTIGRWAKTNNVKLFLGESGVSQRSECLSALDSALGVVEQYKDVWYGWTYWTAGAWLGNDMFNVESSSGQAAQGAVLKSRAATLGNLGCAAGAD